MPLIGTAGHVDHGKSTLIQALTGRDPDRWDEEKRRGLTIDLGFAWADLGGGKEVSFVDVPGHEKYLKNMLAGIEAIDVALFVVAADEGWMPQSEEHLAVLDLLEVRRGVVALTKIDLVDSDMVELASLEIHEKLAGTTLEHGRVVPVSATTGSNIDELRNELRHLADSAGQPGQRLPRLWIDRSFSVPGTGTVVTGTLLEGPISLTDTLEVYPTGDYGRVRSLQTHERETQTAQPGTRVAVGLSGLAREKVRRGQMLGTHGAWRTTKRFSASLKPARYAPELTEKGAYVLHVGSGGHPVRILKLEARFAVMTTEEPLPLRSGDRFILRDSGRRLVVGGGRILDPAPRSVQQAIMEAPSMDPDADPDERASRLLRLRGHDRIDSLSKDSGGGMPIDAVVIGETAMTSAAVEHLIEIAEQRTTEEHRRHPLRSGLPIATLATSLDLSKDVAEEVVKRSDALRLDGPDVSMISHQVVLDAESAQLWESARARLGSGLDVPTTSELGLPEELLHLLLRQKEMVRVSEHLVYLPEQIGMITDRVKGLKSPFGVGDVKDALGLSRKYIVPILEWLDANGVTVRRGENRTLRQSGEMP